MTMLWTVVTAFVVTSLAWAHQSGQRPAVGQDTTHSENQATAVSPAAVFQQNLPEAKAEIPLTNARIKFRETDFDFGSIAKGAKVAHNYQFVNEGSDTLVITQIRPTCGCTTTKQKGMKVAPGDSSSIDIIFDSGRFNNRVTKGIMIECNDALNPYLELRFKAHINNPLQNLEYAPLEANFGHITLGQKATVSINLTNVDSTVAKLCVVEKPLPTAIKTEIAKTRLKPGETTTIKFTTSENLTYGQFASSLTIEAENKPNSRVTIPIFGVVDSVTTHATPAGSP